MNILIVEDEAITAMCIAWAIEDMGHVVHGPVPTAREALTLAAGTKAVDLAMLNADLADGRGAGLALAHTLRSQWGVSSMLVSGSADAAAACDAAVAYLAKPCSIDSIEQSVAIVLAVLGGRPPPTRLPRGLHLFA